MVPENEEPLRSQDFLDVTKQAMEEVKDLIEQDEESKKELFMIKKDFSKELEGTLLSNKAHLKLIEDGLNGKKFYLQKIMTGSKDGFTIDKFNELCVDKGPTLTVIKSHLDLLFGGFTSVPWMKKGASQDESAFIFSLTKDSIHRPRRKRN